MKYTDLRQTISMMDNADYKERFKVKCYQISIRLEKLKAMVDELGRTALDFTPTCPRATYDFQIDAMEKYKGILEVRAKLENVELIKEQFKAGDLSDSYHTFNDLYFVGIDTPQDSYTYHYEGKYWDLFDCEELEAAKHWDGHTDKDVTRLLSL